MSFTRKVLGHGIGLRPRHFTDFCAARPAVDWVEAISENYMSRGGRPVAVLEKVRRDMPVVLHGVSLSIGAVDRLDERYLRELALLIERVEPAYVSDHLSWGRQAGQYVHDLWPLPFTEEAAKHVVARVAEAQDRLGRQILLENVSSYVTYRASTMSEWEFLSEVATRADCGILLDVNNVYVNSRNHDFDADEYIARLPHARVAQIHLAGHTDNGSHLLDTHDGFVTRAVWELYERTIRLLGAVPTLIEWDDNIPELDVLLEESGKARAIEQRALGGRGERSHVSVAC